MHCDETEVLDIFVTLQIYMHSVKEASNISYECSSMPLSLWASCALSHDPCRQVGHTLQAAFLARGRRAQSANQSPLCTASTSPLPSSGCPRLSGYVPTIIHHLHT